MDIKPRKKYHFEDLSVNLFECGDAKGYFALMCFLVKKKLFFRLNAQIALILYLMWKISLLKRVGMEGMYGHMIFLVGLPLPNGLYTNTCGHYLPLSTW